MKKLSVLLILAALALGVPTNAAQKTMKAKDATWLADESVMTSNIDQARGNYPLGAIVAYPRNGPISTYVSDDWMECNGQPIPATKDIVKKLGITQTPNLYKGESATGGAFFLRAAVEAGVTGNDTIRSHKHGQPAHTHKFNGKLTSTDVTTDLVNDEISGTAGAQRAEYEWTWWHWGPSPNPRGQTDNGNWIPVGGDGIFGWAGGHNHTYQYWGTCYCGQRPDGSHCWTSCIKTGTTSYDYGHAHIFEPGGGGVLGLQNAKLDQTPGVTLPSAVAGKVLNKESRGDVNDGSTGGLAHDAGADNTFEKGNDESSPTNYQVRYFMRVNE